MLNIAILLIAILCIFFILTMLVSFAFGISKLLLKILGCILLALFILFLFKILSPLIALLVSALILLCVYKC